MHAAGRQLRARARHHPHFSQVPDHPNAKFAQKEIETALAEIYNIAELRLRALIQ